MLVFFHPPDCVIWCYWLGWNHFLSIKKGNLPPDLLGEFVGGEFPVPPTERVIPGSTDPRVFSNRGTTFISSISTLWSRAILSFLFLVRGKPVRVKLCSACSSCFQSGVPFKKTLRKIVWFDTLENGSFLDTQLEGPDVWKSWIFNEKDKIQPFWFWSFEKFGWKIHHSNKRSIWYIFLGLYFVPMISSKSKSTRELGCFGRQKTTPGSTIS